jgi:hypothetical protein
MKKLITIPLIMASCSIMASDFQVYKVQAGDTLSELLEGRTSQPLYPKNGAVNSHLEINRLDDSSARKLKVGSYLMLPSKKKSESDKLLEDKMTLTQSAISREGLLSKKISKHQNIEISARFSSKQIQLKSGEDVSVNENYQAKIKLIGNQKGTPTIALAVANSTGIVSSNNSDLLVEYKPNVELESTYNFMESSIVNVGALASVGEESNIQYEDDIYEVRRDQNLWLGAQASKSIEFKSFNLDLYGYLKSNVISNSTSNDDELNLLRTAIEARVNLTKDLFLSGFVETEHIDRSAQSAGLTFIYKL